MVARFSRAESTRDASTSRVDVGAATTDEAASRTLDSAAVNFMLTDEGLRKELMGQKGCGGREEGKRTPLDTYDLKNIADGREGQ